MKRIGRSFVSAITHTPASGPFGPVTTPTTFLLKDYFHLEKEDVAFFFYWVTFPWNVKPLVGILTDAFPLFGTRRRHYMMLGSIAAGGMWLLMGASSTNYSLLLATTLGM